MRPQHAEESGRRAYGALFAEWSDSRRIKASGILEAGERKSWYAKCSRARVYAAFTLDPGAMLASLRLR